MRASLLFLCLGAETLAAQPNYIFYPPAVDSRLKISNFVVSAGDTLNITWSTTYASVDIRIEAYAADSNFTVTSFFDPSRDQTSYFPYTLQPRDYYINETSTPIEAYFQIADHDDNTTFIRSQNFSIMQPRNAQLDASGIPEDASTWTGSVTLLHTQGTLLPTTIIQARATPKDASAAPSLSLVAAASSTASAAPTAPTAPAAAPGPAPGPEWLGVGVGVAAGIIVLLALFSAASWIARKKRLRKNKAKAALTAASEQSMYQKPEAWTPSTRSQVIELEEGRVARELEARPVEPGFIGELPGCVPQTVEAPGDTVRQSKGSRKGSFF